MKMTSSAPLDEALVIVSLLLIWFLADFTPPWLWPLLGAAVVYLAPALGILAEIVRRRIGGDRY
jgi:hypothetical protein